MENNFNHREEKLKQLADEFQIEVDMDQLWADVEPQLPPQRRRRYAWFFLLGLFLFIGGFATSKMLNHTSISDSKNASTYEKEQHISSNQSMEERASHTKSLSSETSNYNTVKAENRNTNTPNNTPTTSTIATISTTENTKESITFTNASDAQYINPNKATHTFSASFVVPFAQQESSMADNSQSTEITQLIAENTTAPDITIDRPTLLFAPIGMKSFTLENEQENLSFPAITPTKSGSWSPFLSIASGIYGTSRNMTALPENGENILQQNESILPGFMTNLDYGLQHDNRWNISVGLSHRMSTYRFAGNQQSITQEIIPGAGAVKIEDDGSITNLGGDLLETTINNSNIRWHRTHQYVDLRLSLGKNLLSYNRLRLDANVNAAFNIWSHHQGYYIDEQNAFTTFSGNEYNPYTNNGIMTGGAIKLSYDLGKMQIGLSPFALLSHSIDAEQNYVYKTKNSYYGIQFNALYKL